MIEPMQHLQETFAEQKDSIDLLCQEDSEFRALCRDFDDCVDALRHWVASGSPEADARAREYGELLGALCAEIRQILKTRD